MKKMLPNFQADESSHEAFLYPYFKIIDCISCLDQKGGKVLIPIPVYKVQGVFTGLPRFSVDRNKEFGGVLN